MIVTALDHVNVTTPSELEEETVAWYGDVLGLARIPKPEGARVQGAWFRLGNAELHVGIDEHNPHHSAHCCLVVDDFEAAVAGLRDSGCHIEQARPIPGRHRCFTRDPAGNRIELMAVDEAPADVVYEEA